MLEEVKVVLDKVTALDNASEGEYDQAVIDAAQELKAAALGLVRKSAARDIAIAELVDGFDRQNDVIWNDDSIQFPRLLAEVYALITLEFVKELCHSMDLEAHQVIELFNRATQEFDRIKSRTIH